MLYKDLMGVTDFDERLLFRNLKVLSVSVTGLCFPLTTTETCCTGQPQDTATWLQSPVCGVRTEASARNSHNSLICSVYLLSLTVPIQLPDVLTS